MENGWPHLREVNCRLGNRSCERSGDDTTAGLKMAGTPPTLLAVSGPLNSSGAAQYALCTE